MSTRGGRRKDPVWIWFTELPPSEKNKGVRAKCKSCGKEMQGLVARLKDHIQKSVKCTTDSTTQQEEPELMSEEESENEDFADVDLNPTAIEVEESPHPHSNISSRPSSSRSLTSPTPSVQLNSVALQSSRDESLKRSVTASSSSRAKRPTLDPYVIKTSKDQKNALDIQIARSIYATNTPFRAVEHPEYKLAIEMLRPGYSPPNRNDIGNKLLDEVYDKQLQESGKDLKNKTVCMSLDGWSNVHNEPVVCASVTTSDQTTYLTDTIDTSGHAHTSEYLTEVARQAIRDCREKFHCRVGSLVTDNTGNIKKMRKELDKDETLNLITYGCSAHLMHLLAKDVDIPNVKNHVVAIVKYFRNNHFASAAYRATRAKALPIPQDVRWNTVADCLEAYIKNWPTIMQICEENREKIDADIKNKVSNLGIKRNAEDLLKKLKPIAVALDKLQRDLCSIGRAVDVLKQLEEDLTACGVLTANDKSNLQTRFKQALTPAHYLANIMTPSVMGKNLTEEEYDSGMDWANENHPNIVPVLIKYKAKAKPFSQYMFSENVINSVQPLEWWTSQQDKVHQEVIDVAEQLHTATASTADVERVFSSFGLVQSKLRNCLGLDKAAKLVFLFKAMNQNQKGK